MEQKRQFRTIASLTLPEASSPLAQQQTSPLPAPPPDSTSPEPLVSAPEAVAKPAARKRATRVIVPVITLLLIGALYFVWFVSFSPGSSPGISQQEFGTSSQNATGATSSDLHVYVLGAVKNPGVYVLPAGARVYQVIQAAGGPLPNANLVALNMAAPLTDGQEVYVVRIGEAPPTYQGGVPGPGPNGTATSGQLVNINTASVDELRQALHVSSTTAQKIVDYRTQHGPYTSVDQLLQVISRSIYDRIKDLVTV